MGELHQSPEGCTKALGEIGSATLNLKAEQCACVLNGFLWWLDLCST